MDIELTTTTALPPNSSEPLIIATAPELINQQSLSPASLSTTLPTHQMHSACRIYQTRMPIRRRCRSECLQTTPATNPTLDLYLEQLNGLQQKINLVQGSIDADDLVNSAAVIESDLNPMNGVNLVNGNGMFSIVDSYRGIDRHDENIKENISTDSMINELKNKIIDEDDLKINGNYTDFDCDNLNDLCADQVLIDNQKRLLKMNAEIDKKYFDILNSARTGFDEINSESAKALLARTARDGVPQTNGNDEKPALENRRRVRARSESDPNEAYQLEIPSPLAAYECDGDDFSLKRAREDKPSSKFSKIQSNSVRGKSCSPTKLNGYHLKLATNHLGNLVRSRPSTPRHFGKSLATLKRQKAALLRARTVKRASSASPSAPVLASTTSTPMVVSVPLECSTIACTTMPSPEPPAKLDDNKCAEKKKDEDSDTEYSSLEDDDDYAGVADDDENDSITDSEDNFLINENSTNSISNLINGSVDLSALPAASMLADCVQGQHCGPGPLTPSLFANVPPYITFATDKEKGPEMPAAVTKILKWKLTTITPIVIRKVLFNTGFRLLKKTNDYMGVWGKHMKSPCFKTVRSYQKINHIPGSFQIGRKDRIWRNLQTQMSRHGRKEFNFMPHTYILPHDLKQLRRVWPKYNQKNTKWIIKPPASARGTGIKVVNKWTQIPKRKPLIVQKYVDRPLLINGSKFDLRLYVLVTSVNPLRAYMHTDGLARFASVKYSDKSDTLNDRYMHLTNYSINKLSANYTKNEDATACQGHKWTVQTLLTYLAEQGVNTQRLWAALRNLVLRTIFSGEHAIHQMTKVNVGSKYNCFELFGIDVILDSELKPWLLEVNISPSLHSSSPLDLFVKSPLVTALLNTALFQVPPRLNQTHQQEILSQQGLDCSSLCFDKRLYVTNLTKAERVKHSHFAQKSMVDREEYLDAILENLTPDDVRCLLTTEDELSRCAPLERIFPTSTTHRYLQFTENPRYYNRLLDAWETRYGSKRREGTELLKKYCSKRYHLTVPPQPVKKVSVNSNDNECKHTEDEADDDDGEDEEFTSADNNKTETSSVTSCNAEESVAQNKNQTITQCMENENSSSLPETDKTTIKSLTNGFFHCNNSNSNTIINNHLEHHLAQSPLSSTQRLENCKHDTPLPLTVHSGNTQTQSDSDSELLKSPSNKLFLLNSNGQLNDIENTF